MGEKFELSPVGRVVWEDRYALKDEKGNLTEKDISETFRRVAKSIASKEKEPKKREEKFYDIMMKRLFCPAGRVLANSGTHYSQLLNCFVLPFEKDSLESIMDTAKRMAIVFKFGGGCGFNYSTLRPSGSYIKGVNGRSCGVIGFLHMMSTISEVIEQGGSRRSASLGLLEVGHPDIWEFISYKNEHNWERLREFMDVKDEEKWRYFKYENLYKWQMYNVSVGVSNEFFEVLKNDGTWTLSWEDKEWELYTVVFKKDLLDGTTQDSSIEVTADSDKTAIWKVKKKIPFPTPSDKFEVVSRRKVRAKEIWDLICYNAWSDGCPGLINMSTAKKMHNIEYASPILSTNPCLHGDTMVAVADGRNAVSIQQLAKGGKDVPVYCRNKKGGISIRMMRNPRITGYNQKLLKVTISNGHQLKVTESHKFVLSDGTVKEATDLARNDSLSIMNKLEAPFEKVIKHSNSKSQNYYWINSTDKKSWKMDHRLIYKFYNPDFKFNNVIHHKDYKGLNNFITNLEEKIKKDHDDLHSLGMVGNKNPMRRAKKEWSEKKWRRYRKNMSSATGGKRNGRYSGISNERLFQKAVELSKKAKEKLTIHEWEKFALENNYPSQFSNFRFSAFGTAAQFLDKAAVKAGVPGAGLEHALLREYKKYLRLKKESDLDLFFNNGIKVQKICEYCGTPFVVPYYEREQCYCSTNCNLNVSRENGNNRRAIQRKHSEIRKKKRATQIGAFIDLKQQLNRIPLKKELVFYCKNKGIPFRLPTKREIKEKGHIGTFCGYKELKETALLHNHRVISVEPCETGIVYNGTVDEYHNFYIGHFTEDYEGNINWVYINNLQCGEQALPAHGSCNLSSIVLSSFVDKKMNTFDFEKLKEVIPIAVRFSDDVIDNCTFPIPEIQDRAIKERRVGLGVMGVHDTLIALKLGYDTKEGLEFIDTILLILRDEAYKASIELAKEKGSFPLFNKKKYLKSGFIKTLPKDIVKAIEETGIRNATLLTQAPTGTTSILFNVSSGCEPWFSMSFQRNTKLGSYEDGCSAYKEWAKEHPNEPKPSYFKTAQEITHKDHVKMLALFSKNIDSSVSKTVNLPNSALVEDVSETFLDAMKNGVKGITVFRDGSKEGVLIDRNDKKKIIKEAQKAVHNLQGMKEESVIESRMSPKKRGNKTIGSTYRVRMQKHNLYITVNRNIKGELVEVFATVGENKNQNAHHTSGVEDSWAEGLAKMISLALRAGVDEESVIRNLKNIPSDKPVFTTVGYNELSELIPSPPHAIARAIEEEMLNPVIPGTEKRAALKNPECASCGKDNTRPRSPTCYTCLDCGYETC